MKPVLRLACLPALPLALAACQQEQPPANKGTAAGEILPGSASDAMLPYDTVRSQPPLAPPPVATGRAAAGGDEDMAQASEAPAEDEAEEPAAAPAAAPKAAASNEPE